MPYHFVPLLFVLLHFVPLLFVLLHFVPLLFVLLHFVPFISSHIFFVLFFSHRTKSNGTKCKGMKWMATLFIYQLSVSKYNVLNCFSNNSRTQSPRDLRFSPIDRGDIGTSSLRLYIGSNHFKTNHRCRTFQNMHESRLPVSMRFWLVF